MSTDTSGRCLSENVPTLASLELEVRSLRDAVYGHPSTDNNWETCKENWMRPDSVQWLREHATPHLCVSAALQDSQIIKRSSKNN